jgi:hypothetical protein
VASSPASYRLNGRRQQPELAFQVLARDIAAIPRRDSHRHGFKLAFPELAQVTLGLFEAFAVIAREGVD